MTRDDLTVRLRTLLDALASGAAGMHGEDPDTAGLLVAFSGGPDSMALLDLAAAWAAARARKLAAAHFNHHLRGEESARDEQFCREACHRLMVPLHCGGADPRPLARQRGRGLEEAARHLRLGFLEETRIRLGLQAVATGHHRDDQAETVLMRLYRGTGLDGLRGMRLQQGRIIRPLLAITRAEILNHLQARGLPWREDATNIDGSNTRSRIRSELLPLVQDIFGAGAALNPARLADLCEVDLAHLDDLAAAAFADLAVAPQDLAINGLLALPEAVKRRVVRLWLQPVLPKDLALVHVTDVLRWLAGGQSGTGLDLPGPLRLLREFDTVRVAQEPPPLDEADRWCVRVEPLSEAPASVPGPWREGNSWRLISAADELRGALQVRAPRPGDRLRPFGLAGSKKLSDLVREKRVAVTARGNLLVVADQAGPVWAVGVAQDERTRVLPTTRRTVTISVERRRRDPGH